MSRATATDNGAEAFVERVRQLRKMRVRIGVLDDGAKEREGGKGDASLLQVAAVHEFGASIEVTPKMRRYLASQGLHLKATTTHITIPQRSFIRATADEKAAAIGDLQAKLVAACLDGKVEVFDLGELLGAKVAAMARARIAAGIAPPNHPFTKARKGSSTPLVGKTGQLQASITWKTEQA